MKIILFVLMLFVLSGLFIIHNNNLNVFDSEYSGKFVDLYSGWVSKFFSNVGTLTGNAVKLDWFPE
jgi:hypothetical protein